MARLYCFCQNCQNLQKVRVMWQGGMARWQSRVFCWLCYFGVFVHPLPPHQRVDLVFGEPVLWRADPASFDGFGDERGCLLPEFPDLLVGEFVLGEVGKPSGFSL